MLREAQVVLLEPGVVARPAVFAVAASAAVGAAHAKTNGLLALHCYWEDPLLSALHGSCVVSWFGGSVYHTLAEQQTDCLLRWDFAPDCFWGAMVSVVHSIPLPVPICGLLVDSQVANSLQADLLI